MKITNPFRAVRSIQPAPIQSARVARPIPGMPMQRLPMQMRKPAPGVVRRKITRYAAPGTGAGICTSACLPGCCFNEGNMICCVTSGNRSLCISDCFSYGPKAGGVRPATKVFGTRR